MKNVPQICWNDGSFPSPFNFVIRRQWGFSKLSNGPNKSSYCSISNGRMFVINVKRARTLMPDRWRRFFIAKEFSSVPSMTHFRNYSISKLSQYSLLTFGFVMAALFGHSVACGRVISLFLNILRLFVHSILRVSQYLVMIFGNGGGSFVTQRCLWHIVKNKEGFLYCQKFNFELQCFVSFLSHYRYQDFHNTNY